MMALLDDRFTYIAVNQAYLDSVRRTSDELIGNTMSEVFGEEFFKEVIKPNAERCLSGEEINFREWIDFPASPKRYMDITYYPYRSNDNKIRGFVVNGRDITEHKKAEEEKNKLQDRLRSVEKMEAIGTMAGGIAHDFNNILSAIIGYTEISLDEVEEDSLLYNNLSEVFRAGGRAKSLVKQILTFSRQSGQESEPVQVKNIIDETLKLIRASIPTTIDIQANIKSDSIIMADPTQIHQILMNLCTNASYAMEKKGGVLNVLLENIVIDSDTTELHTNMKPGTYVHLTVSDTGCGMSSEVKERIFDPFFTTLP